MISNWNTWSFLLLLPSCLIIAIRSDSVEGSRLLDEAFRDYDKRFRPNFGGMAVPVNVSIHLLTLSNVNPTTMTYTMTFFIRQIWTDSRLSFSSRRNIDQLTMDSSTSERIWKPDTYFINEISSVDHDLLEKNQFCRISQEGVVLYSRKVTLTAISYMNTNLFPYDSHKLNLLIESYGSQTKDLIYNWNKENAVTSSTRGAPGGFLITGYGATDSIKTTSTGSYSGLSLQVTVKRNALPYELGIMLSSLIISLLCLSTTSQKLTAKNGIVASAYLIFLLALLYGFVIFNTLGGVSSMNILQLYELICFVFCIICVLLNWRRCQKKKGEGFCCDGSYHEKTSEAIANEICNKSEEVPLSSVSSGLENKECPADDNEENRSNKRNTQKWKIKSLLHPQCLLGTVFLAINVVFVLLCRIFQ